MSTDPVAAPCCPLARHLGKITTVAVLALAAIIAVNSLRADDKERPEAEQAAASQPPQGAVLLFDGKDLSKWQKPDGGPAPWKVENGYMEVRGGDIITKDKFRDCRIHIEFMPPDMGPQAKGQARGNSGVYVMNAYEIQVLDSYGLPKLEMGDCASIYSKKIPDKNAAKPPGQWQTYDMEFKAPKFDASGKKVANGRITIVWNGQKVHDNIEIDGPCPGGAPETPQGGAIRLQDHGNPVRFRNIWVVPGDAKQ